MARTPYTNFHDLNLNWIIEKIKTVFTPDNPPPYPVTSVNQKTGAVELKGTDIPVSANDPQTIANALGSKYVKPASGIPGSDLAPGVIPDPTSIIDDNAGSQVYDKTWSAHKLFQQEADILDLQNDKQDAPASAGTAGQVMGLNSDLEPEWVDMPEAQMIDAVDDWLSENITNPSNPPLDRSLSLANACAPADLVGELKNALEFEVNTAIPVWAMDQSYNTPSSVTSKLPTDLTPTAGYACTYLACTAGDVFYITGHGGSGSKLWNWTQSDGTIISRSNSNAVLNNSKLTAPANSAYLLVSVDTAYDYSLIKSAPVNERIDITKKLVMYRNIGQYGKYTIEDGIINLLSALRSIPGKEMSSAVFYTTSIFNYESLSTNLAISTLFEPLRVRDENGNQIETIYCRLDPAEYLTAIVAYGYRADGSNDRPYRASDVSNGVLVLDSSTYYLVLHQYSNLDLLIGTEVSSIEAEYHVGAGHEYTSFHDCLVALQGDNTRKTIHVYGGTYDILAEMGGAEFLAGLSSSDNWYDVCDIIPPNTHIIGHGNVIFNLTIPSGTSADIAVLLSPINMMGSATIENVTINCNGGRYCVHAEGERITTYDNAVWKIINCKINKSNNLPGVGNAIGAGVNNGDLLEIRDCVITNDGNAGLLVHDQQNTAGGFEVSPRILVDGCAIDVSAYPILMSSTHSGIVSGAVLEMTVINCYVANKFMRKIGAGNADVFHATYINTPHRIQNGDGLLNIIPDTDYNNFALT